MSAQSTVHGPQSTAVSRFTFHVLRFTHHASPRFPLSAFRFSVTAFTLLEVMIASGIFFLAVFSILALVSNSLRNANTLRRPEVDAGMAAALIIGQTNTLTEGSLGGDVGDWYPDYSWDSQSSEVDTNGLWQVDIVVNRRGHQKPVDAISIWVYSPDSKGSMSQPLGAPGRR